MLRFEKRNTKSPLYQRILFILLALVIAGIVIGLCGYNPFVVYREMLRGSLSSSYYLQKTIQKTIPFLIMGLGIAVCFKMNFINIGAEGQYFMGAVGATYAALFIPGVPMGMRLVLMFLFAFVCGGIWCMIAGILREKWGVSETLVTLMLNYVALKLVSYLQRSRWKDPKGMGFPKIANFPDPLRLGNLLGIPVTWILAVVITVFVYLLLHRTRMGYEIAVMGVNPKTARYAGIHTKKLILLTSLLGGGICGLSGMIQASAVEGTLNDSMGGMGYTAIAIAYMAHMEPVPLVIVSFLFAILVQGGAFMEISMQIPSASGDVIQGVILLIILGSEVFSHYKVTLVGKEGTK